MSKEDREFVKKLKSISFGTVQGGTPMFFKRTHDDMTSIYRENNSPLAEITKDKAMFRAITQGNASDKKLNRDVEAIERARVNKKKQDSRQSKLTRINKLKTNYKKKYGVEA